MSDTTLEAAIQARDAGVVGLLVEAGLTVSKDVLLKQLHRTDFTDETDRLGDLEVLSVILQSQVYPQHLKPTMGDMIHSHTPTYVIVMMREFGMIPTPDILRTAIETDLLLIVQHIITSYPQWSTGALDYAIEFNQRHIAVWIIDQGFHFSDSALISAARYRQTDVVKAIIQSGSPIDLQDDSGDTAIVNAIRSCESESALALIKAGARLDTINDIGRTPLMLAISLTQEEGMMEVVEAILKSGRDYLIDQQDSEGDTALMKSIWYVETEPAIALIKAGARLDTINDTGKTPLLLAIVEGMTSVVNTMVESGRDYLIDQEDSEGNTAVMSAVILAQTDAALLLLDAGARMDVINNRGHTLLQLADKRDQIDVVRKIFQLGRPFGEYEPDQVLLFASKSGVVEVAVGLRPYMVDVSQETLKKALFHAIYNNQDKFVEHLLDSWQAIAIIDAVDDEDVGDTALIYAGQRRATDVAKLLIDRGARLDISNAFGVTILHVACEYSQDLVDKILEKGNPHGMMDRQTILDRDTPLMIAIRNQQPGIARILIDLGARLDAANGGGVTALHEASRYSQDLVETILGSDRPYDLDYQSSDGNTPVMVAITHQQPEIASLLIKAGAQLHQTNVEYQSALMLAITRGMEDTVKEILESGRDCSIDYHALRLSIEHNLADIAVLLITHGARVNLIYGGRTPLMLAAERGMLEVVKAILGRGDEALVDSYDSGSRTALMYAIRNLHGDVALALIEMSANLGVSHPGYNHTPLMFAAVEGMVDVAKAILAKDGTTLDFRSHDGTTALMYAINHQKGMALALIEKGADVHLQDNKGRTALMHALKGPDDDVIHALIGHSRPDLDAKDHKGRTALAQVVQDQRVQWVQVLLENGADPSIVDNRGWTILMMAVDKNDASVVNTLLENERVRATINDVSHTPVTTAMMLATFRNNTAVMKALCYNGANLDLLASDQTPLMIAAGFDLIEATNTLLEMGANPMITDSDGYTAEAYTTDPKVKSSLEAAIANVTAMGKGFAAIKKPNISVDARYRKRAAIHVLAHIAGRLPKDVMKELSEVLS